MELLCRYSNGRKEMVNDFVKLEDFRYAVQESNDYDIQMSVLETCLKIAGHPRGADALVNAGYWKWILGTIETQSNPKVRTKSFTVLSRLKGRSLPGVLRSTTPAEYRTLETRSVYLRLHRGPPRFAAATRSCRA